MTAPSNLESNIDDATIADRNAAIMALDNDSDLIQDSTFDDDSNDVEMSVFDHL